MQCGDGDDPSALLPTSCSLYTVEYFLSLIARQEQLQQQGGGEGEGEKGGLYEPRLV
jgi:hypothetical protein